MLCVALLLCWGNCSEEGGPATEGEQKKEEGEEVKAGEGGEVPAEEEDKEMTYEEYMALKSKVRKGTKQLRHA